MRIYTPILKGFSSGVSDSSLHITNLTWYITMTSREGIACISLLTNTPWCMSRYATFGICSTRSNARICTLIIDTSQMRRTLGVDSTFGPTLRWSSDIACGTRAYWMPVKDTTYGIRTARRGNTWIYRFFVYNRLYNSEYILCHD